MLRHPLRIRLFSVLFCDRCIRLVSCRGIIPQARLQFQNLIYPGLYRTLLFPRKIDEGGRYYSAFDDKIHDGEMYTCFSLWDTYRALHPLLTLVAPERVDGMMQALVDMQREGGWLPLWPNPSYTGIMCGAPAEIVLAEACVKGFRGFNVQQAYAAVSVSLSTAASFPVSASAMPTSSGAA